MTEEARVEDILAGHERGVVATAEALRRLVLDTLPEDTREVAYPGWHGIGYRHARAGYVCGIFPLDDSVRLSFERGVDLSDPDGDLAGEGSQVRWVEARSERELPRESIIRLVNEAFAVGLDRRAARRGR